MAKTQTTATDNGRDVPTDSVLDALAVKVRAFRAKTWVVADALSVALPRTVAHWRHRTETGVRVAEKDIFSDLADRCDESPATLKWWRNVSATFPKTMRTDGVSISVYKALASLAWADDRALRSSLVDWVNQERPTVRQAEEHAKAIRLRNAPPTDPTDGDGGSDPLSASDANGPAVTSITMDELIAMVNDGCVRVDRDTDATEDGAAIGCVETLMETLSITATQAEELIAT